MRCHDLGRTIVVVVPLIEYKRGDSSKIELSKNRHAKGEDKVSRDYNAVKGLGKMPNVRGRKLKTVRQKRGSSHLKTKYFLCQGQHCARDCPKRR